MRVADAELGEELQSSRRIFVVSVHDTLTDEIRAAAAPMSDRIAVAFGVAQVVEHTRVVPAADRDLAFQRDVDGRATRAKPAGPAAARPAARPPSPARKARHPAARAQAAA